MKRGLLIYNPAAGAHLSPERMRGVIARAAAAGVELVERPTTEPGDATRIAARALADPPDLIAVAGGDGTIAEVGAAVVDTRVPIAILPYGTANVLAREYGIGANPVRAERVLASSRTRALRAWRTDRRPCFLWMGVGLDARMMATVQPMLKRRFGRAGIGWTALGEFLNYAFPAIAIEGIGENGRPFAHEATYAVAANIRRYGGDMMVAPAADPEDDLLDLVLFTGRTLPALARFLIGVALGEMERPHVPNVIRLRAREMNARPVRGDPVDVQIDGDVAGVTPASIGPVTGKIRILVPE
ncbi:MAG TPA: diacylglycerol kinase family protein [Gemmatimonadaceae bacterium]|nr:diacylglycerol kinase family protein [Gemmatimonadaceae bacterium]